MHTLQLETGHRSQRGYYEDFCDGEVFQAHPLYSLDCDGVQLFLYLDEVEICNPLGSKRKKHKLGKLILYIHLHVLHSLHTSHFTHTDRVFLLHSWQPYAKVSLQSVCNQVAGHC